ncbi:MAG: ribonuclease III [Victivallaceae bacterium]
MPEDIEKLKLKINYNFKNKALLREALTHRSYAVESSLKYDNQRLEFLGDSVLQIILTEYLYLQYPSEPEGTMSKIRSAMVQQETLAQLARKFNLGAFLLVGRGEQETGGNDRDSTLSDLFESLLGAYYLDAGIDEVKKFILDVMLEEFPEPIKLLSGLNPKGILQEYSQRKWGMAPEYTVINVTGPDHSPCYEVEVKVNKVVATGTAKNKKQAESKAAKNAVELIAEFDSSIKDIL